VGLENPIIIIIFEKIKNYDNRATSVKAVFARGGEGADAGEFSAQA